MPSISSLSYVRMFDVGIFSLYVTESINSSQDWRGKGVKANIHVELVLKGNTCRESTRLTGFLFTEQRMGEENMKCSHDLMSRYILSEEGLSF